MAVPKKKTSISKRDMRRSHHALKTVNTTECGNCGARKLPHHLCASCGQYNGHQVLVRREESAEA